MALYFNSNEIPPYGSQNQEIEININSKNQVIFDLDTSLENDDYEYLILDFAECIALKNQLTKAIEHLISLSRE